MPLPHEDIRTRVNVECVIPMTENASTGYRWTALHSDELKVEKVYAVFNKNDMRVGGPASIYFRVKSDTPGDYDLILTLARSWNGQVADTMRYIVHVEQ